MDKLLIKIFIVSIVSLALVFCSCRKKPTVPSVTTTGVTSITRTSAISGGNVKDDGGSEVIARGICWGDSENPTISNSTTSDGVGVGTFTSNLTQLTVATEYYIRAYATNEVGTAYGEELIFTTEDYESVWTENFESYNVNTFPGTWIRDANAYDAAHNFVTNSTASEGTKSLSLFGLLGGCWGSLTYRSLETTAPFIIEIDIKNGDEYLSGCHPRRAEVVLKKEPSWTSSGRYLIQFANDGYMYLGGEKSDAYTTGTWYKLKIIYERPTSGEVKLSFWKDGDFKGDFIMPALAEEDLFTYFGLVAEEGTVWFDNIRVMR